MEMMRTIQDLRTKFNKEIGTLKSTQTEGMLSGGKDRVTKLNRQGILNKTGKEDGGNAGHNKNPNL